MGEASPALNTDKIQGAAANSRTNSQKFIRKQKTHKLTFCMANFNTSADGKDEEDVHFKYLNK